ncbi:Calcipressin [Talaromyces proteolyticus]|uniref:Calcipressin n=1 Tax=Talaromyces proteolyticus TaxID=1131652 RepID=A0AAD4Q266_9EURO|nr:Calcipressin [Talaromyces proteolyticus]KAH8699298.1 Calcipressin [Talaromyces proteolyticus]
MASSASTAPSAPAKSRPSLSIDLSNLPPLSQPSPPSNTLIITELHNILLFQPSSLAAIRQAITSIAQLNSFSPLPSFRRIVCSFLSTQDAVAVRQHLERTTTVFGEAGVRSRVYFGEHTPIESAEVAKRRKLLEAPHAQKLFFISPPPSPPHGWVMRKEDPPNKEVHATDLAEALSRLGTTGEAPGATQSEINSNNDRPPSPLSDKEQSPVVARMGSWPAGSGSSASAGRSRSSTLIYHPSDHGGSPNLPAVMVEDTSILGTDSDLDMIDPSPVDGESERKILAHTARPPVELM